MAINVDMPAVTDERDALRLMFHHLELAASYFEATPKVISAVPNGFSAAAMTAWISAMDALYPEEEFA
tara:strand:- start:417 stop:620 length:204 start_codon:yes stop_codon:yes gene_type:complete